MWNKFFSFPAFFLFEPQHNITHFNYVVVQLFRLWFVQPFYVKFMCISLSLQFSFSIPNPIFIILTIIFLQLFKTPLCQPLPGMCHRKAPPLPDALVHHELSKQPRGAPGGEFGRRGTPLPSDHTGHSRRLQLQMHVLFERPDARVHVHNT